MSLSSTNSVAYIGLGTNLGNRIANLKAALDDLESLGELIAVSSVYETEPVDVNDIQPKYLNMTVALETRLNPRGLLSELLEIERVNGRVRKRQNEARTLDLDILLMGDLILTTDDLTLPHPRMHERAFVMVPLAEIAPETIHPILKRTASEIAANLDTGGIERLGMIDDLTGS